MDAQNTKRNTKSSLTDEANNIILNLRQQQSSKTKQPAQERLKRLQQRLKYVTTKRLDKERHVATRSSSSKINARLNTKTATCQTQNPIPPNPVESPKQRNDSTDALKDFAFNNKPKQTVQPAVIAANSTNSIALRSNICKRLSTDRGVKNAWAKPKALLDASNRLDTNLNKSANERLSLLRDSLQQQQQKQELEETKNNNKNNTQSVQTQNTTQKLPADVSAQKKAKPNPNPDDVEPMDIDSPEVEELAKPKTAVSKSTTPTAVVKPFASTPKPKHNSSLEIMQHVKSDTTTDNGWPDRLFDHMYFVLDTNVLIDHLVFVEDLCQVNVGGSNGTMLFIPYVVIKELDNLKSRRSQVCKEESAKRAIRFLNDRFDKNLKIQAQSAVEESEHLIEVDCPDDSIINCCLQLKSQIPHVTLLTNDNNLRLKAKASGIRVSCRSDLMNEYQEEFDALLGP